VFSGQPRIIERLLADAYRGARWAEVVDGTTPSSRVGIEGFLARQKCVLTTTPARRPLRRERLSAHSAEQAPKANLRQKLQAHAQNASCAACQFEPAIEPRLGTLRSDQ